MGRLPAPASGIVAADSALAAAGLSPPSVSRAVDLSVVVCRTAGDDVDAAPAAAAGAGGEAGGAHPTTNAVAQT